MKKAIQGKPVVDAPITSIGLDLTNNCTLKCDYCFRGEKNKQKLSWQVGTRAIDLLVRYSQSQKSLKRRENTGEKVVGIFKKVVGKYTKKAGRPGKSGEIGYLR